MACSGKQWWTSPTLSTPYSPAKVLRFGSPVFGHGAARLLAAEDAPAQRSRGEIVAEAAARECVCDSKGMWQEMADELCEKNGINAAALQASGYRAITDQDARGPRFLTRQGVDRKP